ncbi:Alpha-galactosidase [Pleurotus pulmonarius]
MCILRRAWDAVLRDYCLSIKVQNPRFSSTVLPEQIAQDSEMGGIAVTLSVFAAITAVLAQRDIPTGPLTGLAATTPTSPPSKLIGRLPALGWNSWNAYRCDINEAKIIAAASQLISLGLKDAGYEYVNIDDCWAEMQRDPLTQRLVPDSKKFPNGIKNVADKIHAMGLKFGIYSDAGSATCERYPGSLGYELIDAETFSGWGVDYLKYDNCNVPANWTDTSTVVPPFGDWYHSNSAIRYRQMGHALASQPRPIEFAICSWGEGHVWEWGSRVGHSWRMTKDSRPQWSFVKSFIETNVAHLSKTDFFGHNDMDMMEIGNGDLDLLEQRTHFAAWAFLKSPILLGTDLSALSSEQVDIIKNKEFLAFNQDATVGTPALPFIPYSGAATASPPEYYAGRSSKGVHVFVINTSSYKRTMQFSIANVPDLLPAADYRIHDMWTGADQLTTYTRNSTVVVTLAAHDTAAYLIDPVRR